MEAVRVLNTAGMVVLIKWKISLFYNLHNVWGSDHLISVALFDHVYYSLYYQLSCTQKLRWKYRDAFRIKGIKV